jgi:hypothetical protein
MSHYQPCRLAGRWGRLAIAVLVSVAFPGLAVAQPPGTGLGGPRLLLVQPPGGQAGTTVEVTFVGQDLEQVRGLYFSQPGIKAKMISAVAVAEQPAAMKKKRGPKARPAKGVRFQVHIPADTPLGIHDVRVLTADGISNARAFVVGDVKEFVEKEPNNDVPQSQRVELNCVVHGAINNPTDVDYFHFVGHKGQRVIFVCEAASIDSKLEPALEVYGPSGSLVALARRYRRGEALADAVLPEDGDYDVRISSFAYVLGGSDYFYRLRISTAPWIDAVFPPMVEPGKKTVVTVYGRNLPGGKPDPTAVVDGRVLDKATVTVTAPSDPIARQRLAYSGLIEPASAMLDGFELRLRNEAGASNPFLLTFAQAPVVLEAGDNDNPESAQEVSVPCEVAGRFEKKGDRDWFAFTAKKGEVYSIEAYAERLGAPVDLRLSIRRSDKDQKIAELEDNLEVFLPQVLTRSDDPPRYRFVAPADGRYLIGVNSTESYVQFGPRHYYRLRISREQPDFRILALPPAPNALDVCAVPQGGHQLFTLLVWRLDGFNGAIHLSAEGLPQGVTCPPQTIPPGSKLGFVVVSADPGAPVWAGAITLKASAQIGGKEVMRQVRAAGASWPVPQVNLPAITRLERSLVLAVCGPAPYSLTADTAPCSGLPGQRLKVPLRLSRRPEVKGRPLQVTALALPQALTFQQFTIAPGKDAAEANFTIKPNAEPGAYTVVLRGQMQVTGNPKKKQKGNQLVQLPSTPITVMVLPKALAKLNVPAAVRVKPGGQAEVVIKIARLHNYKGPFDVQLVLPKGGKGLKAEPTTIPAGANEAHLLIRAVPGAAPGPRPNVIIRAIGRVNGTPTRQEMKLNVTVVK